MKLQFLTGLQFYFFKQSTINFAEIHLHEHQLQRIIYCHFYSFCSN